MQTSDTISTSLASVAMFHNILRGIRGFLLEKLVQLVLLVSGCSFEGSGKEAGNRL